MDAAIFPTLEELLKTEAFAGSRVLAGEKNLGRRVESANSADVPDYYNWIAAGELLMSSCYAIRDDEKAQAEFIPTLAAQGLAGVCVKSSRFLDGVPECMLRAAQELDFPLIDLVPDVRFADLSRAVAEEIARRRTAALNSALSVNQLLTQMITVGASLDEIAETVSEISGSSVLIVDEVNHRRGCFSPNGEELGEDEMSEGDICHQIFIEDLRVGKLCLWGGHTPLSEAVLSQILHVIPLEISRSHAVRETENSSFTDFFFHLLSDRIVNEQLERERAMSLGLDLEAEHVLLRARFSRAQELGGYSFFFRKSLFLRQLRSRIEELGLQVHMIQGEVETLLLLSYPGELGELSTYLPRLEKCVTQLFREHGELDIAIGCSRAHTKIVGLLACDREASLALRTAVDHGGRYFLQFDNLGILRLLYASDPQQESQLFVKEVFKDLLTDPTIQNAELLETLESYFRHQGNRREMARELYIHYNTVSYRLRRISELTHMSLERPEDRLQLELALYLYQFRTPQPVKERK